MTSLKMITLVVKLGPTVQEALRHVARLKTQDFGEKWAWQYARDAFYKVGKELASGDSVTMEATEAIERAGMQKAWLDTCMATQTEPYMQPLVANPNFLRESTRKYVNYLETFFPAEAPNPR